MLIHMHLKSIGNGICNMNKKVILMSCSLFYRLKLSKVLYFFIGFISPHGEFPDTCKLERIRFNTISIILFISKCFCGELRKRG